jgi:opacity protein-like surface antigen
MAAIRIRTERRMKKRVFRMFVLTALSALIVSNASAQGGFFFGVQGGWSSQKPSLEDVKFNSDTTFLYGARVGVKFMMVAVELNYFQAAHSLEAKELLTFDWHNREIDYNYLGLNVRVYIPLVLIHPYFTAGYGNYSANIKNIGKDKNRGINVGLGLELHLGDKFSLMAEGKYHRVEVNIEDNDLKLDNYTLSGGINIYF